ncbi:putative c6 zinc finger domain protein [Phaeomoniella chlamydospora]|uniref:Putative c6 zinc finger domain protein n=1 Tax=Phaeomoniella chlamydospora TaxID=158046 RepID=A0A0G2H3T9_PHACM|nr:putative c6 zinc finger domain protein [Phaeomoniella chlamydospora]
MFHSTKTNGWVRHAGGVSALIRARGPALAVASTFDRLMFMAYRHALVIHAFEANTECFLTEPAWADTVKQIEEEIADGTAFNALAAAMMEEMAKFPGAIAKARDLPSVAEQAMFPAAAKLRDELKLRIIKHRETYKRLYAQITIDLKSRNQNPRTKAAADPNEILFPNQFEFDNMSVASIHSGYWTCLTMLNVTLIEILRAEVLAKTTAQKTSTTNHADPDMTDFSGSKAYPSPPRPLSQNQMERQLDEKQLETDEQCVLDPSTLRLENIQNATNSCKAVDYMSTSQFQGPFLITFALRVSLLAFPGERERAWVRDQLRKLGRKFGMAGDIEDEDALRRVYEDILSQKQLAGSETPLSDI